MEDIKAASGVEAKYKYIQKYNHMYDIYIKYIYRHIESNLCIDKGGWMCVAL